jgi:type II secretory pathway pseudopilin PulG
MGTAFFYFSISEPANVAVNIISTFTPFLLLFWLPGIFVMTILGWVAVTQIRRSAGKLYGMWLAILDGLLFPLLVLDFFIWYLCVISTLVFRNGSDVSGRIQFAAGGFVVSIIISALTDWLIIRCVWRVANKPVPAPVSPVQKPDHFWRWFAVAVFALISIPILISIVGLLAAIAIPNFVKGRQLAQENARHAAQVLAAQNISSGSTTNFYIGQTWFPQGDSIEITSVERNETRMIVKGHYHLVSQDNAQLALNITSTNKPNAADTADDDSQHNQISRGDGDFELMHFHLAPGLPHVSMYAGGHPFASLYFGTQAEADKESKLDLKNELNAPKVISVFPADGATNVDTRQELRIRFDQPMNPNVLGISWVSGGFLPDGQSRYVPDRNEFVIPVRLIPGQTNDLVAQSQVNGFGGFRTTNLTYAGNYRWHFTTRPAVVEPGAVKPRLVEISPDSGQSGVIGLSGSPIISLPTSAADTLPVLTLLEITFDQPMRSPDQSFPYLRKTGLSSMDMPALIPVFDYDPVAHRFTIPIVMPPDNDTKLILDGFYSTNGMASDPVVMRCQIGTNSYSGEQLNRVATAAKNPQLEQLLSSMKVARARLNSGIETVQGKTFYGDRGCFNWITASSATFRWQGTNQVYADISEIMNMRSFILGDDGKSCWLYADGQNGCRLDSTPATLVADIQTPVADAFALSKLTVAEAIAKGRLVYKGRTQLDGRACHRVQSWVVHQPQNEHEPVYAAKLEWWIDAETLLPLLVVSDTLYGCETFTFHYDKINQPLPDTAFQPPAFNGINARQDTFQLFKKAALAPGEKRFLNIKDGSNGEMSGRIGWSGPDGTTSSGLN